MWQDYIDRDAELNEPLVNNQIAFHALEMAIQNGPASIEYLTGEGRINGLPGMLVIDKAGNRIVLEIRRAVLNVANTGRPLRTDEEAYRVEYANGLPRNVRVFNPGQDPRTSVWARLCRRVRSWVEG